MELFFFCCEFEFEAQPLLTATKRLGFCPAEDLVFRGACIRGLTRGQFHETKLSLCLLSGCEETCGKPKNTEKSCDSSSEKIRQMEISYEFLPHEVDPWIRF